MLLIDKTSLEIRDWRIENQLAEATGFSILSSLLSNL